MICYYFEEDGVEHVIVPYVFSARAEGQSTKVFLSPDRLEKLTETILERKEIIAEKVRLGYWTKLNLRGDGLKEISSLCFSGKTEEASKIAFEACSEILKYVRAEN